MNPEKEKQLILLENRWLRHKRLRNLTKCVDHKDYLTMKQREEIIDKIFIILFND